MVITNVSKIEEVGGGSCRCMLVQNWSTVPISAIIANLAKTLGIDINFDKAGISSMFGKMSLEEKINPFETFSKTKRNSRRYTDLWREQQGCGLN